MGTWTSGVRIDKFGLCGKMLDRMTNEYGMIRVEGEDGDFRAFHSIQLGRYLMSKGSRRFGSPAEKDMVNDVILSAWQLLNEAADITDLTISGRLSLFREYVVIFPY